MKKTNVKILDCTLRDGGYYNNWDFNNDVVNNYLKSMTNSSIDFVEIGFRFLPRKAFLGPFAFSTDSFLNSLNLPDGTNYGVMINAKEYLSGSEDPNKLLNKFFDKKINSPISLVRVAIDFNSALEVRPVIEQLKNLGYKVGLNLMQANNKNEKDFVENSKEISSWQSVDVLYFADSLGNMNPADVKRISAQIKKGWSGDIGIHTHNNKNLALINSITAIENGVLWCDSTVTGMGRGAGNVSTESLLLETSLSGHYKGNANLIQPTVDDFTILKSKYNWGSNIYYHYAANHGIHPTYVQSLLSDKRYNSQQVISSLELLADRDSTNYNTESLRYAIYGNQENIKGSWDATNWLKNKEVLIVGAGYSVKKYKEGITQYIQKNKPTVLFLNINRYLETSLADATVVSHQTRALFDSQYYQNLNHPLILPRAKLGKLIQDQLKGIEVYDYGLNLVSDEFSINPHGCIIEWPLVAPYAFALVTQANALKISLVGFDGFSADDPRQEEMNDVFKKYFKINNSIEITSLTPSTYRISQSSLFSPLS